MRCVQGILLFTLAASPLHVLACSCFGPETFCETLHPLPPQFPDPQWWVPDHIVLGVKLSSVEYGADLKVVQDFSGGFEADQVVRVWGDCGFLCRMYVSGVADGDTVLWAIQECDLSGNGGCGANLEQTDHFQLSVCGVYWLGYADGVITGPLFTAGAVESIALEDFASLVSGCLSMDVEAREQGSATVTCTEEGIVVQTDAVWSDRKQLCITDASGRLVAESDFRGSRATIPLPSSTNGILLMHVYDGQRSYTTRFFAD